MLLLLLLRGCRMSMPAILKPLMRCFCSWCKAELKPIEVEAPTDLVSHGACPACAEKQLAEFKATYAAAAARQPRRVPA